MDREATILKAPVDATRARSSSAHHHRDPHALRLRHREHKSISFDNLLSPGVLHGHPSSSVFPEWITQNEIHLRVSA